jgi:hypothetical protein
MSLNVRENKDIELPGLDSNQDKENQNPTNPRRKRNSSSGLDDIPPSRRSAGRSDTRPEQGEGDDPELAALVAEWPTLPEPIRAAIRALVGSVSQRWES